MIRHHYLDMPKVTSPKAAQGVCKRTFFGKEQAKTGEDMAPFIPPRADHRLHADRNGPAFFCIMPAVEEA
ncbi:MAG: hypothetical protein WDA72_02940 [Desulfomonilia bacterium]|mgnify:CR=1 FL=1|jgi:hypothetical protein|nr:hypothetical protein [Deltaproteobacteria bacterium]MDX9761755.1 hypothetical protein [Desulfomonilia bacterium]HPW69819.1 hypothetical protein [Deltaproteobacteria bacterium]